MSGLAFTLAEVLITLGIIGVVAAMIIPTLVQSTQEREAVTGLLKFNSTLQQSIAMWRQEIGCNEALYKCIANENLVDDDFSAFEKTVGKYFKIVDKTTGGTNIKDWLPDDTLNYYGNSESKTYGKVAHIGCHNAGYLLQDGTTLSMDFSQTGFAMYADVNGKKPPNRIGKDTFPITVGFLSGKDINYYAYYASTSNHNTFGLCRAGYTCDPNNTDPAVGNGASPTAYVMLNHKLPDFKGLSQTVAGFKP